MKQPKLFGLAVVAAVVLMALAGACTASATVLCKNNTSTEMCSEPYSKSTEFKAVPAPETSWVLTAGFVQLSCPSSGLRGQTENQGSTTETVQVELETPTSLTEGCKVALGNCPNIADLHMGSLEIHSISGTDNGLVTSSGTELTVSCNTVAGPMHCIYATKSTSLGTLTGGNSAKIDVNVELPRLQTSSLCQESKLEVTYEITSPNPLYVSQG